MTQQGIVLEVQDNGKTAVVEFERSEACEHCGACRMANGHWITVPVPNTAGANVGDRVEVQLHSEKLFKATAIVYLFPLAMFLLGLWVAPKLQQQVAVFAGMEGELFSCLTALVLMALAFLAIRLTDKKRAASGEFSPKMLCVASPAAQDDGQGGKEDV